METISKVLSTPSIKRGVDLTKLGMAGYFTAECSEDCPICSGLGYVRRDLPLNDPGFGKLFPCPNSHYLMDRSGLTPGELSLSWGDIKDFGNVRGAVDAVLEALDTAACYIRMAEALQYIREAFDSETYPMTMASRRLEFLADYPVLCLDEIDRYNITGFAKEQIFLLMDKRYEANVVRGTGVTLIASNRPPEALDGYLSDRVRDGRNKVYQLTGESVRPLMG
jgi:DNA replication protein DnaC